MRYVFQNSCLFEFKLFFGYLGAWHIALNKGLWKFVRFFASLGQKQLVYCHDMVRKQPSLRHGLALACQEKAGKSSF